MSSQKFRAKDMKFKQLGKSGLKVPVFAFGGGRLWAGDTSLGTEGAKVKDLMQVAWDHGCNYFDNAEIYANGESEIEMGRAFKELGWERSEYMVTTKVFFGTGTSQEPNSRGLSRKHIIEGVKASLARLQLDYVDVVHAHRADSSVPMVEIVRAFDFLINKGLALYWGTSEWSAQQIQEAFTVAEKYNLIPPVIEQPQYSMLHREKVEVEYDPLFRNAGYACTVWSPLKSGILTGKYNNGIPSGSRFGVNPEFFKEQLAFLESEGGKKEIESVKQLTHLAQQKLDCTVSQLALAWAASNPHISSVILGATTAKQLSENLGALKVIDKLTPEIKKEIESILDNTPVRPDT